MLTPIKNTEWAEATKRQMSQDGESFEDWRDEQLRSIKLALFEGKGKEAKAWENYLIDGLCQRYWLDKAPKPKKKISKPKRENYQSLDSNLNNNT